MKINKLFSFFVILALLLAAMPVMTAGATRTLAVSDGYFPATINTGALNWSVQYLIDQSQTVLGNSQLTAPRDNRGLAISPDGRYLYAGYNNGPEVRKIDLTQADYTDATIARTTVSRGKAIAVDDQGRVFLADGGSIKILDANLSAVQLTISVTKVEGVAVKREGNTLALYATERGGPNTLTRWALTESGGIITSATKAGLDGDGVITISGASDMRGVAIDSAGRIWIADPSATTGNGKVFRINSDGSGLVSNMTVPNPYAIAFNDDEVLVTGGYQRVISVLNSQDLSILQTLIPPWADLELDPDGNGSVGSLTGIVMTPSGFYVTNEAGQTENAKSTYGRTDSQSGSIGTDFYTDLTHDDNDPILKAMAPNQPPVADPGGPYLGAVNTPIVFDGSGSSDPDGNPLIYAWEFGDATMGAGQTLSHVYNAVGIYDVCLTVNDGFVDSAKVCTYAVVYDPSGGFVTGGGWIDSPAAQTDVAFNSIPDPLPGNLPSQPYQAQQTAEFGDHIQFAGTARDLSSVTVTMSSWAKHSDYPLMPAAGFTHPLTLNIYNVDKSGATPALGSLIKSVTQDFVMQWRPEADPTCPGGTAWKASNGTCYNGFVFNIVFDLSSEGITLPDEIIYGIAANTQTWGYAPIGLPGPYNSLNFALNTAGPSTGTDVEPDAVFWNTKTAAWYSDGGTAGVGTFRRDTGWTGYVPAVRFSVTSPGAYTSDPTLGGKASFGFVSKYKKGATVPDGNTEFQFKAGNLSFSSTSYEWLVVNQAGANAQFKGTGTINGTGSYGFMLWAGDGAPDTFRIKIWDVATGVVVYDNGVNQPIGGGSIVVHKK